MLSNSYAMEQVVRDLNVERAKDASLSRLLQKARRANQKRGR